MVALSPIVTYNIRRQAGAKGPRDTEPRGQTMSSMNYISKSGKEFTIESVRGNLSGKLLGFYVWDKDGNLVCEQAAAPVEPFPTIDAAEAFADEQ